MAAVSRPDFPARHYARTVENLCWLPGSQVDPLAQEVLRNMVQAGFTPRELYDCVRSLAPYVAKPGTVAHEAFAKVRDYARPPRGGERLCVT